MPLLHCFCKELLATKHHNRVIARKRPGRGSLATGLPALDRFARETLASLARWTRFVMEVIGSIQGFSRIIPPRWSSVSHLNRRPVFERMSANLRRALVSIHLACINQ